MIRTKTKIKTRIEIINLQVKINQVRKTRVEVETVLVLLKRGRIKRWTRRNITPHQVLELKLAREH